MRYGVLGELEIRLEDGRQVFVGGPRVRALLAHLLLGAGRPVSARRLIDALYGEQALPGDPGNALQSQVSRLRRELRARLGAEAEPALELHPAGYRLAVAAEQVDAHRFTRLAAEGRQELTAGGPARAAELLGQALALWRGPALADIPSAAAEAARLEEERTAATEDLATAKLALGRLREAAGAARALLASHPLRERPRLLLVEALHADGRPAEALTVYEEGRRLLAEELGTDPSPELAAAHLAVLRGEPPVTAHSTTAASPRRTTAPDAPPPMRDASVGPTSRSAAFPSPRTGVLPAALTSFVGRSGELRRIEALLGAHRLVTLLGPGGAGKTRLAVEAAGRRPDHHACFVDLAPLGEGAEVAQALLSALGLREGGLRSAALANAPGVDGVPADPFARLAGALAARPPLLVLDNCEHVIEAAAELTQRLLSACPELRVLATSREPLNITGEALCPLPRLAVPPPGTPPGRAQDYPAVRLFAERAAAVQPGFALDADTLPDVLRVCDALDGMPLALELAAARLRTLPLAQVARRLTERLDARFPLLSRGSRTAAPRHRTLHGVVEWSWELLGPEERTLAARFTVFPGGARLDAVAAVACPGQAPDEVEELLASLVDKSLLEQADGRYRMLDTIRAFCAERLAASGEAERLHRAHAEHALLLARTADRHLFAAEQLDWLARLDAEYGNLQAAVRYAVRTDGALALRLIAALSGYWWLRGLRSEVVPLAEELLRRCGAETAEELPEEYVVCVAHAAARGSLAPELSGHLARAAAVMSRYHLKMRHPFTNVLWAVTSGPPTGEIPEEVWQRLHRDPWSRSLAPLSLGFMDVFRGELDRARPRFEEALAGFEAVGDRWATSQALDALGSLAMLRGDTAAALRHLDRALGLLAELGSSEDATDLLCSRAAVLLAAGRLPEAEAGYAEAAELARRTALPVAVATARLGMAETARLRGDAVEARRRYAQCRLTLGTDSYSASGLRARLGIGMAWLALAEQDPEAARTLLREAFATATGHPLNQQVAAEALVGLAGTALTEGSPRRAALLLGAAEALRGAPLAGSPDVHRVADRATALLGAERYAAAHAEGKALERREILALY